MAVMLPGRGRLAAGLRSRIPRDSTSYRIFDVILGETARAKAVLVSRQKGAASRGRWFGATKDLSPVIPFTSPTIGTISVQKNVLDALRSRGITTAAVASASTVSPGQGRKTWRFSTIFLFLPCLATFGLGSWQIIRRQRKIEMLDYRRERLEDEPVPLAEIIDLTKSGPEPTSETADELEYRKVICEGVYDDSKSLFVGPRARSDFGVTKKGYYLITPLVGVQADNRVQVPVLVNRGWVPSVYKDELQAKVATSENIPAVDIESNNVEQGSWWNLWSKKSNSSKNDEAVASSKYQATVKICGVIRGSEQPNMFVPSNAPESGQWFYVDVRAMARAVGLPEDTILIEAVQDKENIKSTDKYPTPKDPEALLHSSVMPQDHINYALTWYTLSAATTYMAVKRVRNSRRGF